MAGESQIDKITAMIEADPTGFVAGMRAIQEVAKKSTEDVSERFKAVGEKIKHAGEVLSVSLTLPLTIFGEKSVKAYDAQEKALTLVETALRANGEAAGFTAQQLTYMSESLQKVSTFGDNDILQGMTLTLLNFDKVQGEVFKRAQQDILDYASQTGMSLESASQQIGRALQDPTLALSVLRRAHITLTDTQKQTIEKMNQMGDVSGAQSVILQALEHRYKGAALALSQTDAGRIAGDMNKLSSAMAVVGKTISSVIVPIADVIGKLADAFKNLSPAAQKFIVIVGMIVAAIPPLLVGLGFLMTTILPALTVGFWSVVDASLALAVSLFEFIVPLVTVVASMMLLVYAGQLLYDNWESLKSLASGVWHWIVGIVEEAVAAILKAHSFLPGIGDKFKAMAEKIKKAADENFEKSGQAFDDMKDKAVGFGKSFEHLETNVKTVAGKIKKSITEAFGAKASGGKDAGGSSAPPGLKEDEEWIKKVGEAYAKLPGLAQTVFEAIQNTAVTFTQGMVNILLTGSGDWRQVLLNALQSMLNAIIQWAVTSLLTVQAVAKGISALFANPILAVVVIAGLIAGIVALSSALGTPKMAKGGVVDRETSVVVGEAGPEVVLPVVRTGNGQMGVQVQASSDSSGGSRHVMEKSGSGSNLQVVSTFKSVISFATSREMKKANKIIANGLLRKGHVRPST